MAGIAGVISSNDQQLVTRMLEKISHRGTSKPEIWKNSFASLGAVKLSSINKDSGPKQSGNGKQAIVMDGSLDNRQIINNVSESNSVSQQSDPECMLNALNAHGPKIFGLTKGRYALAAADEDRFVLARDRLGIQPLYFGFNNGTLCFASEIKGLIGIVEEIHEFPPGHYMLSANGIYPYKALTPEPIKLEKPQDSSDKLVPRLRLAVRNALSDGADVGVWLSGGVDSSVIAALARPFVNRIHTFSAGVDGSPDLEYARMVARYIGSVHHERIYGLDEMLNVLEKTIYHLESFDAPLVNSAVANYLVSELTADHVPLALSGEGADELFAGYAYQKSYTNQIQLTLSVQNAISALHNTALQRVDRSASAHSIGVEMPFLESNVVRFALAIPSRWKIRGKKKIDKWPLREGFRGILPKDVIWREKSKFWEGSGTGAALTKYAESQITDNEFSKDRRLGNGADLRSKEELLYYRIFQTFFKDSIPLAHIGRTQHI